MKIKTIIALLIALSVVSLACNKSAGSAASLSDDEKYKLIYAASRTGDPAIMSDVAIKIGLVNSDGTQTADAKRFMDGGYEWGRKNASFAQEVDTQEKAKAYVKAHLP